MQQQQADIKKEIQEVNLTQGLCEHKFIKDTLTISSCIRKHFNEA